MSDPAAAFTTPRSALFVPADRIDRHAKAFAAGADAVILDLEDAVAPDAKDAARTTLAQSTAGRPAGALALVRINSPHTDHGRRDLDAAPSFAADGLVVPKADVESLAVAAEAGLPLVALIETARGVIDAPRIAAAPGVAVVMLGTIDLATELGIRESDAGDELLAARGRLVLAAAAAGRPGPLDGPCTAHRDPDALRLQIERARRLGFAGKSCIHPAQVAPVTKAFTPTPEEVEWARRVEEAFEAAAGGVAVLDGEMIDRPVAIRARQITNAERRDRDER